MDLLLKALFGASIAIIAQRPARSKTFGIAGQVAGLDSFRFE